MQRSYGPAENLELDLIDRPTIGESEVLMEVHAGEHTTDEGAGAIADALAAVGFEPSTEP